MTLGTFKGQKNWRATRFGSTYSEREQYATVIRAFWLYKKLKREFDKYKDDMISATYSGSNFRYTSHSNIPNSPTENAAIMISEVQEITIDIGEPTEEVIAYPDLLIQLVEKTIDVVSREDNMAAEVLVRRYLQNESMAVTCCDLDITKDIYYRKHNFGIARGRDVAIQIGLIRIF